MFGDKLVTMLAVKYSIAGIPRMRPGDIASSISQQHLLNFEVAGSSIAFTDG